MQRQIRFPNRNESTLLKCISDLLNETIETAINCEDSNGADRLYRNNCVITIQTSNRNYSGSIS
uniref:Uncharacterized protein n=1 Tax=Arundo donax TaxID=35708 RepID=A0A0A9GDJ0_ARUDO